MLCQSCKATNDDAAEVCFICGRALAALVRGSLIARRYEVLSPLGRGGMGMVYKAHDRMLDETVAIKVLRAELANTNEAETRFRHEIKLARRVSHKNVCRIHEYGEDGRVRYISMEFVEGKDLKQIAREVGGVLPFPAAVEAAIQAAEGLQAIHDVGVVHRDLKTANIMRDARGLVRLMDFGVATLSGVGPRDALTTAGQVMGTPEYMSPEQCYGEALDHRSDIYSLGIVLYELLTGDVPFRGDTPVATLFKHIQEPVPFDAPEARRIPPAGLGVLRKALAKGKTERFASATEMAEALRAAARDPSLASSPDAAKRGAGQDSVPDAASVAAEPAAPRTTGSRPVVVPEMPSGSLDPPSRPSAGIERRKQTRLDIFVNLILRRVGSLGTVLQEERTIADNVSRGGARVMTTFTSLSVGDIVHLEEVGGIFKTRAEVRGMCVGKDRIRRLNLQFLDRSAPDYLVHVDGVR